MTADSFVWLGGLWVSPGLLAPALLLFVIERGWTRARRRAGKVVPLAVYLLDAAAVVAVLAAVLGTVLFAVGAVALATRWLLDTAWQSVARVAADPLLLAVVVLALVGGLVALAFARGWRPVRRGRKHSIPAGATALVLTAGALPKEAGTPEVASGTAPRFITAPPLPEEHSVLGRQRADRPRPSPTVALTARHAPATPRSSALRPPIEPGFAASTGLAILNPHPAAEHSAPQQSTVSPSSVPLRADDVHVAPALAMLNQRRRPMNERRERTEEVQQGPVFVTQPPVLPTMSRPSTSGWWHLPLGVTAVLVVTLVVTLIAFGSPLSASISELLPLQGAITRTEAGDGLSLPTTVAEESPGAQSEIVVTPAPSVSVAAPHGFALVVADTLNVRAAPGTDQPVVARAQRGAQLELLGAEQNLDGSVWVRVRYGEIEGWVNRSYIQMQPS